MRILYYIEPFPIRNSASHFADIAKSALGLVGIDPSMDMRVYANDATFEKVGELAKEKAAYLIRSSSADEALFASNAQNWAAGGIANWVSLINGGDVSDAYASLIQRVWLEFPFDIIVSWGENAAIPKAAAKLGAVHIAMELGCTRPPFFNSIIMDPFGANGNSLPARLNVGDLRYVTGGRMLSAEQALATYCTDSRLAFEAQFRPLNDQLRRALLRSKRKIAFLPLQLYDDANLLIHSPYGTVTDVVRDVIPPLAAAGYFTVIKPHPASRHRPNATVENRLARLSISEFADHFYWCDEAGEDPPSKALMTAADLVVTVNSSVGFEALYYDKVVTVLGAAAYKVDGLFPSIDEAIRSGFDQQEYLTNIGMLRAFMLEGYLAPSHCFRNATAFFQRLLTTAAIARDHSANPVQIAKSIYEAYAPGRRYRMTTSAIAGPSRPGATDFRPPAIQPITNIKPAAEAPEFVGLTANKKQHLLARISECAESSAINAVDWLHDAWADDTKRRTALLDLGCVDKQYIKRRYGKLIPPGVDPLTYFIATGEEKSHSPAETIDVAAYAAAKGWRTSKTPLKDMLVDLLQSSSAPPEPLDAREIELIDTARSELREKARQAAPRVAVVAHIYYKDVVPELLDYISNIGEPFDLIVTTPSWGNEGLRSLVLERYPDALVLAMPNRGRDIGPFLELLPFLLERDYLAVLKVQTKKGYYRAGRLLPGWGEAWRRTALASLALDEEATGRIVDLFAERADVSMVGPGSFYVSIADYPAHVEGFSLPTGLSPLGVSDNFFAGTMFWVRPSAFEQLVRDNVSIAHFELETGANDGGLAHYLERYFGHLAGKWGSIMTSHVSDGAVSLRPGSPQKRRLNEIIEEVVGTQPRVQPEPSRLMW